MPARVAVARRPPITLADDLFTRVNFRESRNARKFNKESAFSFASRACIGCIIALAILAWLPAKDLTRTTLGGHAEHFIAYLGTAIILGLTFRKSPCLAVQCVLLIVYAAILEAGRSIRLVVTPLFKTWRSVPPAWSLAACFCGWHAPTY